MSKEDQGKTKPAREERPSRPVERPFREGNNREIAYNNGTRRNDTVQSVMPPPTKPGKKS